MSDADQLDPSQARTTFERDVIRLRNQQHSWPSIARELRVSVRIARDAWARANAHQRGAAVTKTTTKEDPTIGNEEHCRGLPLQVRGVSGAIKGTRPGDPAYRLEQDQRPPRTS